MTGESFQPSELGTPQGGQLSPLLANILLDDRDRELERRGHRFARYADDVLVLVNSSRAGQRVKASLTTYLGRRLKLPVNAQKSKVAPIDECVFLGFAFRQGKLRWLESAFADFKHRIRELTRRNWGVSMPYRLHKLALVKYAVGWVSSASRSITARSPNWMSGCADGYACVTSDSGAGAAPRCATLLDLGVSKRHAILTAISSKSYWHLSRTAATRWG